MDLRLLDAARHEIAHALIAAALGWYPEHVSIDPVRLSGRCRYSFLDGPLDAGDDLMAELCMALAPSVDKAWPLLVANGQCNTDITNLVRVLIRIFALKGVDAAGILIICQDFVRSALTVHAKAWDRASVVLAICGQLDGFALARIDPAFVPRREKLA